MLQLQDIFIEYCSLYFMDFLDSLFNVFENTMSVHLRENQPPKAKHGTPGAWELEDINDTKLSKEALKEYTEIIQEFADIEENTFFEEESDNYIVIQLDKYRIVITFPPFSDAIEITIVRPTLSRVLSEYNVEKKLQKRLNERAEGILIAGAPGHGKSTFASALALFFADKSKIIKTIEKPRDLQLDDRVTQFTILPHDFEKVGDLLLLMRPDYVIFDEIRKNKDFEIYSDMRLAGIGMVGVIHATKPIDSIQRFLNRIELGLIPSIIDTVIFINNGEVDSVLSLKMVVKTPKGFMDQSLARPVIEVKDFMSGEILFELFSFGEQIVSIPIKNSSSPAQKQTKNLYRDIAQFLLNNYHGLQNDDIEITKLTKNTVQVSVPDQFHGVISKDISFFNWVKSDYNTNIQLKSSQGHMEYELYQTKKHLILVTDPALKDTLVEIMVGPQVVMKARVDSNGEILLPRKKATTKRLEKLLDTTDFKLHIR